MDIKSENEIKDELPENTENVEHISRFEKIQDGDGSSNFIIKREIEVKDEILKFEEEDIVDDQLLEEISGLDENMSSNGKEEMCPQTSNSKIGETGIGIPGEKYSDVICTSKSHHFSSVNHNQSNGSHLLIMEKEDIVQELKAKSFIRRSMTEKREIIKIGRPTPTLHTKIAQRNFHTKWYEKIDWLCASASNQKLYCWPCLLFGPKCNQTWTDIGYIGYKNILTDCRYHSKSLGHLRNYKCLRTFGELNTQTALGETPKLEKERHNRLVEENRRYLKLLTNAILYLCKQELPLCCNDEGKDYLNKGNYFELLDCFAKIDSVFASRFSMEGSKKFSGFSSKLQNDIIIAIDSVIDEVIHTEMENIPFFSVQADETTDCSMHAQLSIIIRYVSKWQINERFLGFFDVSEDKSASRLADVIEIMLKSFSEAKTKLVSQTYDGATVMAGDLKEVQSKLNEKGFKYGYFIHSYAHKLDSVLSKSVEKIREIKMFFSHLRSFNKFTSSCTKRKSVFREYNISIPSLCETKWCYKSKTVFSIKQMHGNLKKAFQHILDSSELWDEDTLSEADNLLAKLNSFGFMFFINCFHSLLSEAGKVFDILQCNQLDMKLCQNKINDFIEFVENHRKNEHYEKFVQETMNDIILSDDFETSPEKRLRGKEINYKVMYFGIIDNILVSLRERSSCIEHFAFFELIDVSKFENFAHSFPIQHVNSLHCIYPDIFDCKSLTNELKYMYSDSDFRQCKSAKVILELIHKMDLVTAFSESVKLIQLLLTIPVISVADEGSLSTLDRIRSYLRCTMAQEQLSSLARISVEKQVLNDLETKQDLHEKVLQEFALKQGRLEFIFQ